MKTTKTKKPNTLWLQNNKKMFRTTLATTLGLLLFFNCGLMAQDNTAYGTDALSFWIADPMRWGGNQNSAFGFATLKNLKHGGGNTAVGGQALLNTSRSGVLEIEGSYNTAVGHKALLTNTSGHSNTAVGVHALVSSDAAGNTAVGVSALHFTTSGGNNAAFGYAALLNNRTGTLNTGLGYGADVASDNLTNATAIGYGALVNANNTIQLGNGSVTKVYAGVGTAATVITGGLQVKGGTPAVGKVLTSIDASGSATWQDPASVSWSLTGNLGTVDGTHFIGTTDNIPFNIRVNNQKAGRIDANNAFYGYQSGNARTTGGFNTANGYQALYANTAGDGNTAIGDRSLLANTTGNYNTAIGSLSLGSNVDGKYNTAVGYNADVSASLTNATAIGSGAKATVSNTMQLGDAAVTNVFAGVGNKVNTVTGNLQITGGKISTAAKVALNIEVNNEKAGSIDPNQFNTFLGVQSGNANTGGIFNVAMGNGALKRNNTGRFNTAVGSLALDRNTTEEYNTALGYHAGVGITFENATAIGANAIANNTDKIRLGDVNAKTVEIEMGGAYVVSDGRFKTNVKEEVKGLEFIKKLRPVVYNVDIRKRQEFLTQNMPADIRKEYMNKDFSASTAIRQSGFIAQEVEKAAQEVGYDFNGLHKPENANDNYSLAYGQFVVPLVKAVQEQQQIIEQQQKINDQLQQRIEALEKLMTGTNNSVLTKTELSKPTNNEIQVYPNPNNGMFNVVVPIGTQKMELMDMKGALVKTIQVDSKAASHPLNLTGYAKGIYMLQVVVNGKIQTTKIVVQ